MVVPVVTETFVLASEGVAMNPIEASDNASDSNFFMIFPFPKFRPGDHRQTGFYV